MMHAIAIQNKSIRAPKRHISGVLLLDKPYGISSNKALQIAKYHYLAAKSGHTGTLDPLATGLLPVCFGEATKFSSVLLESNKTYQAVLKLGVLSTTGDVEGELEKTASEESLRNLSFSQCEQVLKGFVGKIMQTPPMYSALKHQGKPLYTYAREGRVVKRQAREINIYQIRVDSLEDSELQITVTCGTGTYIRTLAEDIGKALGVGGAYLIKLCRTAIDCFDLSQAKTLPILEEMTLPERDGCLLPVDCFLHHYPALMLDKITALDLMQGRAVSINTQNYPEDSFVRLYHEQQVFIGLGQIKKGQQLIVKRLLANSSLLDIV